MSLLSDEHYMSIALHLAEFSLGRVWPNPAVGCLIVRESDGLFQIVGQGRTQIGGRPHGETVALVDAGDRSFGATLYTTLEPCAHYGKTPPCVNSIIESGIKRVVSAVIDPDPRVNGSGYARLLEAGILLEQGVLAEAAYALNVGYMTRVCHGRPFVQLKLAHSRDGAIAGEGRRTAHITGEKANLYVHRMRAQADAILVGSGTIKADDPQLTCRLPGSAGYSPVRIVLDTGLQLSLQSKFVRDACAVRSWVICGTNPPVDRMKTLICKGVKVLIAERGEGGRLDLLSVFRLLANEGIGRLLVEGGSILARALLTSALADEVLMIEGDILLGEGGLSIFNDSGVEFLTQHPQYSLVETAKLGQDTLRRYCRRP